jgi:hypothetical protein
MDLSVWVPATIGLGVVALGLMYAFLYLCEKV